MKVGNRFFIGLALLLGCAALSLASGPRWIAPGTVWAALNGADPLDVQQVLVLSTRLPRTLIAMAVGAGLAVAGALMQAMTRNPLASPGLFGINAGATCAIILSLSLFSLNAPQHWLWAAFVGAAVAGALVWGVGTLGRGALSPLRMVLAGAAITALFSAFSQAMLVVDQQGLDTVLFWLAGALGERSLGSAAPMLGCVVAGLAFAWLRAAQVNVLSAGTEIATGLGQRTGWVRLQLAVLVIVLAGSAVALAGSIGFVGLIVPHLARRVFGIDHRVMLPGCALLGACLLLLADVLARVLILPQEVPVGVMMAFIGGPFFILLARRGVRNG